MTDPERTQVAEALLAVIFLMRPDDGEQGQAFTLSIATTALSRAMLGAVGPNGAIDDLLTIAMAEVRSKVDQAQLAFQRGLLRVTV